MEEETSERNIIAALRYFSVGKITTCAVCEEPPSVARVTTTLNSKILITMLCQDCSGEEIDGLLERGEMSPSADGTHLVSPMLAVATNEAIASIAGRMVKQIEPRNITKKKKRKTKKKATKKKASKKKAKR